MTGTPAGAGTTALPASCGTTGRLLPPAGSDAGLGAHLDRHGPLRRQPADRLLAQVELSGLTGRGGAAFPVHRKLRAVAAGRRPVVVANGAEGEPASRKDHSLLTRAPHLVLDGIQAAATAVGAGRAILYVHAGPAAASAGQALRERPVGRSDGADRVAIEIVEAPPGFVSGQESAVVRALDGGPALPRSTPPKVYEKGVGGRPTLVQNVETLAHLALIARYGSDWFRRCGTATEPGTMLCTVSGTVSGTLGDPGVVEAALGAPLGEVLAAGGRQSTGLRGVLVGGYHGAWLRGEDAAQLPLSVAGLAPFGATPGAGVLIAIGPDRCPLAMSALIVRYLADASARQCGPCLNGLPALADSLGTLAGLSWTSADHGRVHQLTRLVEGRGACAHPDGTARLVRSVLNTFPDEVQAHAGGRCLATRPAARAR